MARIAVGRPRDRLLRPDCLPAVRKPARLPCPNYIEKREQPPLFQQQRSNLVELGMLGDEVLPAARKVELGGAIEALDRRMSAMGAQQAPVS